MKERRIRISQCMIVKNEEKNIRRALSWGKDIVWEQIVVDTGSTDQTVQIAQSMGAKVYHFPWIDDFSAAKNFALEKASGDWIAFLDADEYMNAEDAGRLPLLLGSLARSRYLAVSAQLYNLEDNGQVFSDVVQVRFFRGGRGIRYHGRIHEDLNVGSRSLEKNDLFNACSRLSIFHTGYCTSIAQEKQKAKRNQEMLFKELADRPDDYVTMAYLGDTYGLEGDYDTAVEWYEKAVAGIRAEKRKRWLIYDVRVYLNLFVALCEHKPEEKEKIDALYNEAHSAVPQEPDFDYALGRYYASSGEFELACRHLEQAMALLEKYGNSYCGRNLTVKLASAYELLAICYFNAGSLEKCVNCCVTFLHAAPFNMGSLKVLMMAFQADAERHGEGKSANGQQVAAFLGKLYHFENRKDRLFALRAAENVRYEELIQALRALFPPEELAALDKLRSGAEPAQNGVG